MSDDTTPFQVLPAEEVELLMPAYSEISFLAQGGMATVYRGMQTSLDRPVAIKILPREFGQDESFRLRFVAEGKAMAKLNHPNLVSIFDFGEVDGLLYLVMEFVNGVTLHEKAYGKPMDNLEAVDLCQKVAAGLANAHSNKILHRDIKPANVLLDQAGSPKLGDFGLAEGEERAEGDDLVFGTPGYTAPEVMADPGSADEKADIFAIGVMLHELLTTALPVDPYQPPSRLVQSDPRIDAVIRTAIQPNPAQRYATAGDLADTLRDLHSQMKAAPRRKLASSAQSKGTGAAKLATGSGVGGPSRPPTPAAMSSKGSNFTLFRNLIIIAVLLTAIVGVWSATKDKKSKIGKKEAAQQAEIDREKERKAAAAQRERERREAAMLAHQKNPKNSGSPSLEPVEEPNPLTPREQLEELQTSLAAGERDRFPEGSIQRGSSHYFFIEDELTWYEAIEFAERHGAHLAITPKQADLSWLAKQNPSEKDIWLGAGAISKSDWSWLDEEVDYKVTKPRTSTGTAAIATKFGILKARQPSLKLPFFIQWYNNGEQPGTRELDLTKLAKSLASGNPSWPPGILSYQERRYLIIGRNLTLSEAAAIAAKGKGHLAVPSNELEASYLMDAVEKAGLDSLWLGGEQSQGTWSWSTQEPWTFGKWNEGYPTSEADSNGLQINTTGWINSNPFQEAPGFIIEWSDDAQVMPEESVNSGGGALEELTKLREMAKQFLAKKLSDDNEKRKSNFAAQGSRIRQWLRGISQEEALKFQRLYEKDISAFEANSSRLSPPKQTNLGKVSKDAADLLDDYYNAQLKSDQELLTSAEQLRISFLERVENLLKEANKKGLTSQAPTLEKEIEATGQSGKSFLSHLGLETSGGGD